MSASCTGAPRRSHEILGCAGVNQAQVMASCRSLVRLDSHQLRATFIAAGRTGHSVSVVAGQDSGQWGRYQ